MKTLSEDLRSWTNELHVWRLYFTQ